MTIATLNINSALTINKTDGIFRMSVKATGGTVTMTGNATFRDMPSEAITLSDGQAVVLEAWPQAPIDGVTITPGTGTADLIICYS